MFLLVSKHHFYKCSLVYHQDALNIHSLLQVSGRHLGATLDFILFFPLLPISNWLPNAVRYTCSCLESGPPFFCTNSTDSYLAFLSPPLLLPCSLIHSPLSWQWTSQSPKFQSELSMFVSLPLLYRFLVTFRIKAQLLSTAEMPFRFLLLPPWPTFLLVNLLQKLSEAPEIFVPLPMLCFLPG